MTEHVGQCGLCLERRELHESHLLPAALYNLVRDPPSGPNRNPVHVTGRKSFTSSRQIKALFLCAGCEGRFSANGESYVLSQCDRQGGHFKLRELLRTSTPVMDEGEYKLYDVASLLGGNTDQYLYFGASVFWRASARSWKSGDVLLSPIKLGKYQEELRLYLLGNARFPTEGRLLVHVSSDDKMTDMILPPKSGRSEIGRFHKFYIPGILFTLYLGRHVIGTPYDACALNSTNGKFMLLCPWKDDPLFRGFRAFVKRSPAVAKLLPALRQEER